MKSNNILPNNQSVDKEMEKKIKSLLEEMIFFEKKCKLKIYQTQNIKTHEI